MISIPHFVQFAQATFSPLLAVAAAILLGMVTVAALVIVFVRAFEGTLNR